LTADPEVQRRLHDLQQVDTAIRQLEHRRANLPEQRALDENAETLSRVASEYANATETLEQLTRQQKRHEDELASVESRRRSEEGRMYSGVIHNERELRAVRDELSSLKGRKNDLEDSLLEIMEQREDTESLVATLKERHVELKAQVATLTAARDEAATEIDALLDERRTERQALTGDIPPDAVSYYDDLRVRKDGVGVAVLQGRTCSGCRLELTAIELEEHREQQARDLAKCPQCGRILVIGAHG
jgi:uncharacterized protein